MNPLHAWMQAATPAQQQALADEVCAGSRPYLYHWANDRREPSARAAAKMEEFTQQLNRQDPRLPIVWRVDMVSACGECTFAKKCMSNSQLKDQT